MTAPNSSRSEFVNGTVEYALNRRFMPSRLPARATSTAIMKVAP